MAIEALEGLTDEQLFNSANSDEDPADDAVSDAPAEPDGQAEQPRDDAGRFAAQQAVEEPASTTATDPPARTQVDDNAAMVPSWRVREINDEKRTLADRLAALEAERVNWQRQQQAAPQQSQPAPAKAEPPDPLLDPAGYREFIRNELREERLNERREDSLAAAHKTHGKEFEEAYTAAQQHLDPALKARMQQSRDPGETLIQWHREMKTRAEVGNDPNAYFDKRLETFLADPANQAKMLERIRGQAQQPQQPGARPAPAVSLPPSLTRATNASNANAADDADISNDGLWRHANA